MPNAAALLELHVKNLGGFEVRRPLPAFPRKMVGPFIFRPHGARALPAEHEERGVYAVEGNLRVDGEPLAPQHLAVLPERGTVVIESVTAARVMLLGGAQVAGDRHIWWNFAPVRVSESRTPRRAGGSKAFRRGPARPNSFCCRSVDRARRRQTRMKLSFSR